MKKSLLLLVILLLATSSVYADIVLSEPKDTYNLGDRLYVSAEGLIGTDFGNLNINLVCTNSTINLVKISARAFSKEEQLYSIPYKILDKGDLEISDFSEIIGQCQIIASLGANVASTKVFTITDDITVLASLNKTNFNPGEPIIVTITARKANGESLNGYVVASNVSDFSEPIEDGKLVKAVFTSETTEAGRYQLDITASDIGKSGILNQGQTSISFNINSVAHSLVTSLSDSTIEPGRELKIGANLYDQSGREMDGAVLVTLVSPNAEKKEASVRSKDFIKVEFETNATPGTWQAISSFDSLTDVREFEITKIQKVDISFEGPVLIIKNIGNSVYNKTLSVIIGNDTKELELKMNVGEERKFSLKAPEGEWEVVVDDGERKISQNILLTGRAIAVKDFESVGLFTNYSILWVFLIIIFGTAGIIFLRKYKKTKNIGNKDSLMKKAGFMKKLTGKVPSKIKNEFSSSMNFTNKSPSTQSLDENSHSAEDPTMKDFTSSSLKTAESSLVLKGEKYPSVIIAVSIKNYESLTEQNKKDLEGILMSTRESRGLIDARGEHIFIVFSPLITKTYHNENNAVKAAFKILSDLTAYNKKFSSKIEFNIGVHTGELVSSKEDGKLKYTSIGNTISLAKRISDSGRNELLVSDDIRKRMLRDLKVTKAKEIGNIQIYSVTEIRNKEASEAKLKDLLKRME